MSQFRLSAPDQEFNSRVDGLFSCLDEVATQLPADGLVFESSISGIRSTTNKESAKPINDNDGFKRPMECNIPSNKRFKSQTGFKSSRPDYVINPEKWTLYEMKDVEELDEAQNKKAALQLFADLKQKTLTEIEKVDLEKAKIVFKKPTHRNIAQSSDNVMETENSSNISIQSDDFGGTKKFVMDEYVLGVKKKNKKNKVSSKGTTSPTKTKDAVKLSYLKFDDDEDSN